MLNHIKSNSFMGWVAILTVLFLAPNTYYVYYSFSVFATPYREIAGVGVSLIIAGSILIYTLRKNFKVAKYYSLFEVSISAYYYIDTIGWDWGLIPALGFTLILPISVYYYSREFDKSDEIDYKDIIAKQNKSFEELVMKHISVSSRLNEIIEDHKAGLNKLTESQSEVLHWTSEYERAVQGWTNDVSLRDERISELEYALDYNNKILNSREESIKSMAVISENYRNELKKYQDPLGNELSKKEFTVSNPSVTAISTAPASDALPEPKSDTKPAKSQAPIAKKRVK